MRIAVVATHAGAPQTLASTAFVRAVMDGLTHKEIVSEVVGLANHPLSWVAETMEPYATSLPWLDLPPARIRDVREAARLGIFADAGNRILDGWGATRNWYLELALERALISFAENDDLTIMVYPRILNILRMLGRIAARHGWRVVVISTEALTDAQIDPSTREGYIACTVQSTDGVWALSEHLARFWMDRGVPESQVMVSPPAVREAAFEAHKQPAPNTAIYLGNLEHKEVDYLLDISESVMRKVQGYHLTILGDTTPERRTAVVAEIAERGLSDAVSIDPPVSPAEVPEVLSAAEVLVLPRSKGEFSAAGFPNKLGEYLASGRPVVVTRVGDIPKYLQDRVSAYLVDPDDCAGFAAALVDALNDKDGAAAVGAEGKRVAKRLLASPSVAGRIVEFVNTLPARPPHLAAHSGLRSAGRLAFAAGSVPFVNLVRAAIKLRYKLGLTKSGQYGLMVTKIAIVKLLRRLHLWPKAPEA